MAHPTRTGDVVAFSFPPYQFDAETPGTLVAPSQFFGQHGYVPDVQDLAANINMRATFLAGGGPIAKGEVDGTVDRPRTDARLPARDRRAAAQPGQGAARRPQGRQRVQADLARRAERLPRAARPDDAAPFDGIAQTVGGAAYLATLFDEEFVAPRRAGPDPRGGRQRRRLAAELRPARGHARDRRRERVGPRRDLLRQPRVRLRRRAAAPAPGAGELPVPRDEHRRDLDRASFPPWVTPSIVFTVDGVKVGVIGAELQNTPELVSAGATAGLTFLAEASTDQGRVGAPPTGTGVQRPDRRHPPGHERRAEPDRQHRRQPRGSGPILGIADALADTTVDAMIVGHTHRISNLMRGDILITEGINAGTSYSVLQLMVHGGDVAWAGGATRVAKNLGVAERADVKAIVDQANAADGGAPQPGDRHAAERHPPGADAALRVRDGQHGRPTRCGRSTRASTRRSRTPAVFAPTSASRRRPPASSRARSPGARCSPCCRSATGRRSSP